MTRQLRNICMLMIRLRIGRHFNMSGSTAAQVPDAVCAQPARFLFWGKKKKKVETPILHYQTGLFKGALNALTWPPHVLILSCAGNVSLPVTDEKQDCWMFGALAVAVPARGAQGLHSSAKALMPRS